MKMTLEQFLDDRFLRMVRASILAAGARVDSCILSTKMLVKLTERVGLIAEPLTVETTIYNPTITKWYDQHGDELPTEMQMLKLVEKGARYLVIGDRNHEAKEGMWAGHLVAVVRASGARESFVVDISIDQASRPKKGITITDPIVFPIKDPKFLTGKVEAVGRGADDVTFVYQAYPDDHTYESSPDWKRDEQFYLNGEKL